MLQSNGLADITDDAIAAQLRDKHPPRSSELSVDVNSLPEFDVEFALDKRYSRLNINSSPGPDGFQNAYLNCLTRTFADKLASRALASH